MERRFRLAVLNSHPIQYFAPLYRRLAQSPAIDITVFFCSRQGVDAGYVDQGFGHEVVWDVPLLDGYRHKFLPSPAGDRGVRGFFSPFNPAIVGELWRGRYDALWVHGHNSATNLMALLSAKIVGTRVFMRGETHLLLHRSRLKRLARKALMSALYKLCDACLYIGTRNREFYEAHGVSRDKLFPVPYTVDNDAFIKASDAARAGRDSLRARLGVAPGAALILYASKLIPRKRPFDLLRAFARLRARGLDAKLVYVGDGELRGPLEAETNGLGLSGAVVFTGFVNQSALPEYYAAADVFVLPSEDEPWGLIINETMCAGLPVVTTQEVGAATDLVRHGDTGFTFRTGDHEALASHLTELVTDRGRARRMGALGREHIAAWNFDRCIEGVTKALESR